MITLTPSKTSVQGAQQLQEMRNFSIQSDLSHFVLHPNLPPHQQNNQHQYEIINGRNYIIPNFSIVIENVTALFQHTVYRSFFQQWTHERNVQRIHPLLNRAEPCDVLHFKTPSDQATFDRNARARDNNNRFVDTGWTKWYSARHWWNAWTYWGYYKKQEEFYTNVMDARFPQNGLLDPKSPKDEVFYSNLGYHSSVLYTNPVYCQSIPGYVQPNQTSSSSPSGNNQSSPFAFDDTLYDHFHIDLFYQTADFHKHSGDWPTTSHLAIPEKSRMKKRLIERMPTTIENINSLSQRLQIAICSMQQELFNNLLHHSNLTLESPKYGTIRTFFQLSREKHDQLELYQPASPEQPSIDALVSDADKLLIQFDQLLTEISQPSAAVEAEVKEEKKPS